MLYKYQRGEREGLVKDGDVLYCWGDGMMWWDEVAWDGNVGVRQRGSPSNWTLEHCVNLASPLPLTTTPTLRVR